MQKIRETYPVDTAAKLFPPTARPTNTSVFRLSVLLKEAVNQEALQKAAEKTLERYPYMAVTLGKDGFETARTPFLVREEKGTPCAPLDLKKGGFLLRILWYGKRISVEMFHALADGAGGLAFLKTLLYCYLTALGAEINPEGKLLLPGETPQSGEYEDSFLKYYDGRKAPVQKMPPAFKIKGEPLPEGGRNVLHGVIGVEGLKKAARRQEATITEYLCALMVYSIYRECVDENVDDEPIVLSVPVNLRGTLPSQTVRNFFSIINVSVPPEYAKTFGGALQAIKTELREKTRAESLMDALAQSCGVMEHPVVKAVPQFMRDAGMRFVFAFFSEDVKTMTVSNVGMIDLPADMQPYVEHAESVIYPTERSPINCCLCSVNGKLTVSFIRTIKETGLMRFFFGFLTRETGEEVTVYANEWGTSDGQV
ncbi:hypothetical protein [Christensenella intestinihominis]|uniref:hypothetical protein n=1 Tax=Christensenella intestinihominis TaxID=1851429 RepID=UPI0009F4F498|nr:hypothetical protein [Christensenella intestinihominis]